MAVCAVFVKPWALTSSLALSSPIPNILIRSFFLANPFSIRASISIVVIFFFVAKLVGKK